MLSYISPEAQRSLGIITPDIVRELGYAGVQLVGDDVQLVGDLAQDGVTVDPEPASMTPYQAGMIPRGGFPVQPDIMLRGLGEAGIVWSGASMALTASLGGAVGGGLSSDSSRGAIGGGVGGAAGTVLGVFATTLMGSSGASAIAVLSLLAAGGAAGGAAIATRSGRDAAWSAAGAGVSSLLAMMFSYLAVREMAGV